MTRPVQHSRPHPHTHACRNTVTGRGFGRDRSEPEKWIPTRWIVGGFAVLAGMVVVAVFARDIVGAAIRFAQTIGVI